MAGLFAAIAWWSLMTMSMVHNGLFACQATIEWPINWPCKISHALVCQWAYSFSLNICIKTLGQQRRPINPSKATRLSVILNICWITRLFCIWQWRTAGHTNKDTQQLEERPPVLDTKDLQTNCWLVQTGNIPPDCIALLDTGHRAPLK